MKGLTILFLGSASAFEKDCTGLGEPVGGLSVPKRVHTYLR